MYFLDNTKVLNIDLQTFLYMNFTTSDLMQPLPLVFKLNTIQEDISYYLIEKSKDKIGYGENLLEYCIIEGNDCNYIGIKGSLNFEKGKEYRIKLNPYKKEDSNLVYFETFTFIKEIEFGFEEYKASFSEKYSYFLINIQNIKNFSIYFNEFRGRNPSYYSFLSENEKKLLPDNIDKLEFVEFNISNYYDYSQEMDNRNGNDYIILEMYSSNSYSNIIGILNEIYRINSESDYWFTHSYQLLEIEKGHKVGVFTSEYNDYHHRTISLLVLSTSKNMKIITTYPPKNFTNRLYTLDIDYDELIYIDSTYNKTYAKFIMPPRFKL